MATSEGGTVLRSEKEKRINEQKCAYCAKKVVDSVQCDKCSENFHPSCIIAAANNKNATCKHIGSGKKMVKENESYEDISTQNKLLNMENRYLKECQEANQLLREKNQLLAEKIDLFGNNHIKNSQTDKQRKNQNERVNTTLTLTQNSNKKITENDKTTKSPLFEIPTRLEMSNLSILTNRKDDKQNNKNIEINVNNEKERERIQEQQNEQESSGFQVVRKNRKRNKKANVGSGTEMDETDFKSFKSNKEPKKIWLFISKVDESVAESAIQKYVADKCKTQIGQIVVKLLETKYKHSGFRSFMVGVPLEYKEAVYKNDFWPVDISFDRFNFIRGQHFLESSKQKQIIPTETTTI